LAQRALAGTDDQAARAIVFLFTPYAILALRYAKRSFLWQNANDVNMRSQPLAEFYRWLPPEAAQILLVLFLSFLIGLEREEHKVEVGSYSFGGVRTFR